MYALPMYSVSMYVVPMYTVPLYVVSMYVVPVYTVPIYVVSMYTVPMYGMLICTANGVKSDLQAQHHYTRTQRERSALQDGYWKTHLKVNQITAVHFLLAKL